MTEPKKDSNRKCLKHERESWEWGVDPCLTLHGAAKIDFRVDFYLGSETGEPGEKPSEHRREPTTLLIWVFKLVNQ